jgi:RND family efflux transporter MFP subunit
MPPGLRLYVLAMGTALLLAGCGDTSQTSTANDTAQASAPSAMAVTVVPVTQRELARGVNVSGEVAAVEEMLLGVELAGYRVTELLIDVGQPVRRGQVLLRLDRRMLQSDLAQADAGLREAEAGAALARANLVRGEQLAKGRFISATQLDELRAARTQSAARVGTARAAREGAALRLSFAELRAPADGVVSKRLVQPGQVVSSAGELLRMIRDGRLEWRAQLPVTQLSSIVPGAQVELRAPGGAAIEGRVRAVSPGVDAATRTGTVFVDLPAGASAMTGAYLDGRIDTGMTRAMTVPAGAVVLRDGFPTVFAIDDKGIARAHRVRTGARDGNTVEILEGPKLGARIAVRGAGFLADGDRVRVVTGDAAITNKAGNANAARSGDAAGATR